MNEDEKKAAINSFLASIFHGLANAVERREMLPHSKGSANMVVEFDATAVYRLAAEKLGIDPADLTADQRRRALIEAMDELAEEGK